MTAGALLADLEARGVRLWPESGGIHYRPAGTIPADLRAAVVANKPALLDRLAEWDEAAAVRLMSLTDGAVERLGANGDDGVIQALAVAGAAAHHGRDMAGVRKACALIEERALKLAGANQRSAA